MNIAAKTRLYPLAKGELQHEASVLLVGDLRISIPANSEHCIGPVFETVPKPFGSINFFAITGHTHRFGTRRPRGHRDER